MPINRFFTKKLDLYFVYDRLTGQMVGHTISMKELRELAPDERCEPTVAKIGLGQEQAYHDVFKTIWYEKKLQ